MRKLIGIKVFVLILILYSATAHGLTIRDVQYTTVQGGGYDCFPSDYEGQTVMLAGVVTGVAQGDYPDFFIQHPDSSEWYGIFIYEDEVGPEVGDWVILTGEVDEYYGETQLDDLSFWIIVSHNYPLPEPAYIETSMLSGGCNFGSERYEGVLVELRNVVVLTDPNPYGECWVTDGSDSCLIDDNLYRFGTNQPEPIPGAGMRYDSILGLVSYSYGKYRVLPRGSEDFVARNDILYCDVWPHYPPVVIPPEGGNMIMDGLLHNLTDTVMVVDVWADAEWLTGSVRYENIAGCCPYIAYPGLTVYPYTIYMPGYAPAGQWRFWAYAGLVQQAVVYDSGCFDFEKTAGEGTRIPNRSKVDSDGWLWRNDSGEYSVEPMINNLLLSNNPNPFNSSTRIRFELPEDTRVELSIYNLAGRKITKLIDSYLGRGGHQIIFNGENFASGIYFYRLTAGRATVTKRMTIIK